MSTADKRAKYIESAEAYFVRAIQRDSADFAINTLELLGFAALDDGAGGRFQLSDELAMMLSGHPQLVARAAAALGMHCEMDGADALPSMLYARSGYQALLDMGVWPEPPLDQFHLDESDEEIYELVARVGIPADRAPGSIPSGHSWWLQNPHASPRSMH